MFAVNNDPILSIKIFLFSLAFPYLLSEINEYDLHNKGPSIFHAPSNPSAYTTFPGGSGVGFLPS
jgi:hypothetical protein